MTGDQHTADRGSAVAPGVGLRGADGHHAGLTPSGDHGGSLIGASRDDDRLRLDDALPLVEHVTQVEPIVGAPRIPNGRARYQRCAASGKATAQRISASMLLVPAAFGGGRRLEVLPSGRSAFVDDDHSASGFRRRARRFQTGRSGPDDCEVGAMAKRRGRGFVVRSDCGRRIVLRCDTHAGAHGRHAGRRRTAPIGHHHALLTGAHTAKDTPIAAAGGGSETANPGNLQRDGDAVAGARGHRLPVEGECDCVHTRRQAARARSMPAAARAARIMSHSPSGNGRRGARGKPIGRPISDNAALVADT